MRKFFGIALLVAAVAAAQADFTMGIREVKNGPDLAAPTQVGGWTEGNNRYFTFDLVVSVGAGDRWTNATINSTTIHQTDKTIYNAAPPFGGPTTPDPGFFGFEPRLRYDTFSTSDMGWPNVGAKGVVPSVTPDHGDNPPKGTWFIIPEPPINAGDWVIQRITICQPIGKDALTLANTGTKAVTIDGSAGSKLKPAPLTPFNFVIYQVPEPTTLALLALGAVAGLIRRR